MNKNDTLSLCKKCAALENEVNIYREAAALYGIDAMTMLTLAKSQIKTSADNIRLVEKMEDMFDIFKYLPEDLDPQDVLAAISNYDGDKTKPYCDLIYCGLDIIRRYMKVREEYDEWRKSNLPCNT